MRVTKTAIEGVVILEPDVFSDTRGTFCETFSEREFARLAGGVEGSTEGSTGGIDGWSGRFVQDNESTSRAGVVRGLHFQKEPHAQAKLVRVAAGKILDVAVDMRRNSETFGKWVMVELSAENRRQLLIPRGCAHGFSVPAEGNENGARVAYKCDEYYYPESDAGVLWSDPALGIDWGIDPAKTIVSEKDTALPEFKNAYKYE